MSAPSNKAVVGLQRGEQVRREQNLFSRVLSRDISLRDLGMQCSKEVGIPGISKLMT